MKRFKLRYKKSRRIFKRSASRSHKKNSIRNSVKRGGWRL